MLTRFYWCISVALCLEVQPVVSKIDAMLRSPVRRIFLAESEPIRRLLLPSETKRWRNCGERMVRAGLQEG